MSQFVIFVSVYRNVWLRAEHFLCLPNKVHLLPILFLLLANCYLKKSPDVYHACKNNKSVITVHGVKINVKSTTACNNIQDLHFFNVWYEDVLQTYKSLINCYFYLNTILIQWCYQYHGLTETLDIKIKHDFHSIVYICHPPHSPPHPTPPFCYSSGIDIDKLKFMHKQMIHVIQHHGLKMLFFQHKRISHGQCHKCTYYWSVT